MLIVHCIYEYMYMQVLPANPAPGMGSLNDMWGTPPPHFAKFLQHCLYFSCSLLCQSFFYTTEGVSRNNKTSGHWNKCAVTPELQPVLAL